MVYMILPQSYPHKNPVRQVRQTETAWLTIAHNGALNLGLPGPSPSC